MTTPIKQSGAIAILNVKTVATNTTPVNARTPEPHIAFQPRIHMHTICQYVRNRAVPGANDKQLHYLQLPWC